VSASEDRWMLFEHFTVLVEVSVEVIRWWQRMEQRTRRRGTRQPELGCTVT
jgi:hypothetical protein